MTETHRNRETKTQTGVTFTKTHRKLQRDKDADCRRYVDRDTQEQTERQRRGQTLR